MKAQFSIIGFTIIVFTTAWTAPAPTNNGSAEVVAVTPPEKGGEFSFVRAHRQGKGITTSWGVNVSQGIVGFLVQKTYEDPTDEYAVWENVGSTACNGSRSYKCTDNNVYPGNINYRVVALKADGSSSNSPNVAVRIMSR